MTQKASARAAKVQSVVIDDPKLLSFFSRVWGNLKPGEALMPGGNVALRRLFVSASKVLSTQSAPWTLGSLRGGGLCHFFSTTGNITAAQFRGRWDSARTLSHYLIEAMVLLSLYNQSLDLPMLANLSNLAYELVG